MDIGSSSLRTALFNRRARRIAGSAAARHYRVDYRADGSAELDPRVLLRAARGCVRASLKVIGTQRIAAVCGSGFWHSLLGLDREGKPVTPVWTWADSRAAPDAEKLRRVLDEAKIHARTGCMLRAAYWPAKLLWMRRTNPRVFRRVRRWVSPAEWIFSELFGVNGCSASMASGTGLFNLRERNWDSELLEAVGISVEQLGEITAGARPWRGASVFAAIGDGAASNLGSGAVGARMFAINVGTSAAVRVIEQRPQHAAIPAGLFRHVVDEERTVLGGAVSNAGNLRQWCVRELRIGQSGRLSRTAAAQDPLTVLPFWVKERAPNWPEQVPATIAGFTQSTPAAEILRATTCSVFYRLHDILELIETATGRAKTIIVSGGILQAPDALRVLADSLGRDLRGSRAPEASLRGAAVHAWTQLGEELAPLEPGRLVRYDRRLAAAHRERRTRQAALERMLTPLP